MSFQRYVLQLEKLLVVFRNLVIIGLVHIFQYLGFVHLVFELWKIIKEYDAR